MAGIVARKKRGAKGRGCNHLQSTGYPEDLPYFGVALQVWGFGDGGVGIVFFCTSCFRLLCNVWGESIS